MMMIQSEQSQSVTLDYDFDEAQYRRDLEIMAAEDEVGDVIYFGAPKTAKYKAAKAFLKNYAAEQDRLEQILNRAMSTAEGDGNTVSGQTAGAQHKTTGGDDGDGDGEGDPDSDDRVINDPYSSINTHLLSRPINRIARKAILANRQGIEQKNPRVYNWYVSRTLKEIERAIRSVLSKKATLSQESLEEVPLAAARLFAKLTATHDFSKTPNPVFTKLAYDHVCRDTFELHAYVTRDKDIPGAEAARKEAKALGIAEGASQADAADMYAVSVGFFDSQREDRVTIHTLSEDPKLALTPSSETLDGVSIEHLPIQPVSVRKRYTVKKISLDQHDDDDDGDKTELEALEARDAAVEASFDLAAHDKKQVITKRDYQVLSAAVMQNFLPDTEVFDRSHENEVALGTVHTDSVDRVEDWGAADKTPADLKSKLAAEKALHARAGTIARQLVLYVTRALDQDAAALEAAVALNRLSGDLGKLVVRCIKKDWSAPDVCTKILKAAPRAAAEGLFSQPPTFADFEQDAVPLPPDLLAAVGMCKDADFKPRIRAIIDAMCKLTTSGKTRDVMRFLKSCAENRKGLYTPDIVDTAQKMYDAAIAAGVKP
jgi:hypothetical protein